jgi:hypothetical protein
MMHPFYMKNRTTYRQNKDFYQPVENIRKEYEP